MGFGVYNWVCDSEDDFKFLGYTLHQEHLYVMLVV